MRYCCAFDVQPLQSQLMHTHKHTTYDSGRNLSIHTKLSYTQTAHINVCLYFRPNAIEHRHIRFVSFLSICFGREFNLVTLCKWSVHSKCSVAYSFVALSMLCSMYWGIIVDLMPLYCCNTHTYEAICMRREKIIKVHKQNKYFNVFFRSSCSGHCVYNGLVFWLSTSIKWTFWLSQHTTHMHRTSTVVLSIITII